jgi:hypothetical protein
VRLWARLCCGTCGRGFTADPDTVPVFDTPQRGRRPCCLSCWNLQNRLRQALGQPALDRPKAYPDDYPEVAAWPS